jgi:iron complex transport system ATP-binding protein
MTTLLNYRAAPLRLEDLMIRAGGHGRVLIEKLSLRISAGERWALLGPNGAGKSTLLATLAGLLSPAAGSIHFGERRLAHHGATELARQRAWCPQFWLDPFPVSAWETVACAVQATDPEMAASEIEQRARAWLDRLDVAALADTDARTLSGGERQRVALATACAQGEGGTVLAAVHDLNLAWHLATHVLLLDGRGDAVAGLRDEILQADSLSQAFGIPVRVQEEGGERWFRIELSDSLA